MIALWAASTYPKTSLDDLPASTQQEIQRLEAAGESEQAGFLHAQVSRERSIAGRVGQAVEPVFAPLGFDWKISIGVMTSFAAREAVVGTLSVLYGMGEETEDEQMPLLTERLRQAKYSDGSPVFTTAACLSLLVFYVLAMQCLPTQVITRRETGSWGWAGLQFAYMTVLAYTAALVTYQTAAAFGLS